MPQMAPTIYTIGSSTRTWEEFLAVLVAYGIKALADVRAFPVSGRYPHFTREHMEAALPAAGMRYHWLGESLGGYRAGGYEAHMQSETYQAGLAELERIARACPTAFLCAERFPWKCHRRFIGETLQSRGWRVAHILEVNQVWPPTESEFRLPESPGFSGIS
jgi:uncharacterized protein (DUF488 family)